jgi:hypothetical protein
MPVRQHLAVFFDSNDRDVAVDGGALRRDLSHGSACVLITRPLRISRFTFDIAISPSSVPFTANRLNRQPKATESGRVI